MRTLWTMLVALGIVAGLGTAVSAADCVVPTFLVMGKTYDLSSSITNLSVKVIEIDTQACWVKGQWKKSGSGLIFSGTDWFNLSQVIMMREVPSSPSSARPRQRR